MQPVGPVGPDPLERRAADGATATASDKLTGGTGEAVSATADATGGSGGEGLSGASGDRCRCRQRRQCASTAGVATAAAIVTAGNGRYVDTPR